MPYDSSLDQEIFSKTWESSTTRLIVGVYSYNQGVRKVQIRRELKGAESGRPSFAKLGRLTKDELEGILPLLQESLAHVE
ncbi:MAG TPA: hypothetical protein VGB20_07335 [bacterium]